MGFKLNFKLLDPFALNGCWEHTVCSFPFCSPLYENVHLFTVATHAAQKVNWHVVVSLSIVLHLIYPRPFFSPLFWTKLCSFVFVLSNWDIHIKAAVNLKLTRGRLSNFSEGQRFYPSCTSCPPPKKRHRWMSQKVLFTAIQWRTEKSCCSGHVKLQKSQRWKKHMCSYCWVNI